MIFVFEVQVKEGWTAEAYADAWVRASKIIQRAPGSRGTRLHRCIGDPARLLAIASPGAKLHQAGSGNTRASATSPGIRSPRRLSSRCPADCPRGTHLTAAITWFSSQAQR
jgi:hypothetical protein